MNQYEAKFAREAKDDPRDWLIAPSGNRGYRLVYIGSKAK